MTRHHPIAVHSFDAAKLSILAGVFDEVWRTVEAKTSAQNREAVREAIAIAIMDLAKTGQIDRSCLRTTGLDQALSTLKVSARAS